MTEHSICNPVCKACADTFWVCEEHDNLPWKSGTNDPTKGACECGAAGMPCLLCNPCDDTTPPKDLAGSRVVFDKYGWKH